VILIIIIIIPGHFFKYCCHYGIVTAVVHIVHLLNVWSSCAQCVNFLLPAGKNAILGVLNNLMSLVFVSESIYGKSTRIICESADGEYFGQKMFTIES